MNSFFRKRFGKQALIRIFFEFANIRDQDSWVHQAEPEKATAKAKDLVRMAVAKAALLDPIEKLQVPLTQSALVIGGGVAGMNAALNLAAQGFKTCLIEEKDSLGGHALKLGKTWKGEDVRAYVEELKGKVLGNRNIEVLTGAKLLAVEGFVGQFTSTGSGKRRKPGNPAWSFHPCNRGALVRTPGVPVWPNRTGNPLARTR